MWILRTEGEPVSGTPASAFFLASGITTVGRQVGHGTNLALTQDLSISRKHAEINIGPLDVHSAPGSVPSFQLKGSCRCMHHQWVVFGLARCSNVPPSQR